MLSAKLGACPLHLYFFYIPSQRTVDTITLISTSLKQPLKLLLTAKDTSYNGQLIYD